MPAILHNLIEDMAGKLRTYECDRELFAIINRTLNDHGFKCRVVAIGEGKSTFAIKKMKPRS